MRAKNKLESQSEGIEQEGVEKKMTKEEIWDLPGKVVLTKSKLWLCYERAEVKWRKSVSNIKEV